MPVPAINLESRAFFRAMGKRITVLRKEQGMSQAELAREIGISQQTVFAYELGDRRVSVFTLVKLGKIFGVPVEELMGLTKAMRPAKRRLSPAGIRHAERYQQLSKTQQRFLARIIDTLLERDSATRRQASSNGLVPHKRPACSARSPLA